MNHERRIALLLAVVDACADRAQRVDEIADRALVHARHAGDVVLAAAKRQRGRQGTQCGAGVAEKEIGFLLPERPADTLHLDAAGVLGERDPEARKRLAHDASVFGVEQSGDVGLALGERGEQENAIGDALRARQAHAPGRALGLRKEASVHGYSLAGERLGGAPQAVRVARASVISRSRPEASPRSMRSRNTARRAP